MTLTIRRTDLNDRRTINELLAAGYTLKVSR